MTICIEGESLGEVGAKAIKIVFNNGISVDRQVGGWALQKTGIQKMKEIHGMVIVLNNPLKRFCRNVSLGTIVETEDYLLGLNPGFVQYTNWSFYDKWRVLNMDKYLYTYGDRIMYDDITGINQFEECIVPESKILLLDNGKEEIREIREGQELVGFEESSIRFRKTRVDSIFHRTVNNIYKISFDNGEKLLISKNHPIFTRRGWQTVEELYDKYCSNYFHERVRKSRDLVICKICGEPFPKHRRTDRPNEYCSHECWSKDWVKTVKILADTEESVRRRIDNRSFRQRTKGLSSAENIRNSMLNSEEVRRIAIKNRLKRPTGPELEIYRWILEEGLLFEYVGDGEFFVGKKNPDFKHKYKKKLIEFNGWHGQYKDYCHYGEEVEKRTKYFEERGYEVLFLFYEDLKKGREHIVSCLRVFEENDLKHWTRIDTIEKIEDKCEVLNLRCNPIKNYFVNGILVHNCSKKLINDPTTRHASIPIWRPIDQLRKFVPCNTHMHFQINGDGKLDLHTMCRSQDVLRGLFLDIFAYTMLLEQMCLATGLEIGKYYVYQTNIHMYERDYKDDQWKKFIPDDPYESNIFPNEDNIIPSKAKFLKDEHKRIMYKESQRLFLNNQKIPSEECEKLPNYWKNWKYLQYRLRNNGKIPIIDKEFEEFRYMLKVGG